MSLDTVVEDIRDEARAREEEILSAADEEADEIVSAADEEAEEIRAEKKQEVESTIEQEREQRLSSAKLEAKQKRLEARRSVLEDVRTSVEQEVVNLGGDKREELTRALLDAAATEFEDVDEIEVYGRSDDEKLLADILDDDEYDGFTYGGEYDCLGGVVVESSESRIRVNNTFDSVLADVWEENLRSISEQLFEE